MRALAWRCDEDPHPGTLAPAGSSLLRRRKRTLVVSGPYRGKAGMGLATGRTAMQDRRDEGSWAWRQAENHNHMIELQGRSGAPRPGSSIELAYFGGSAFRIVSPAG